MTKDPVLKASQITDAHISYVSLVDKAANKRRFLITKAADGKVEWKTQSRIIKSDTNDDKHHYITGIVYEPMTEDTQGNFMTKDEIRKAEIWFMKNGDHVDVQHSFDPLEGSTVVESWIAKSDVRIGDEDIKEGTWLITVEITDPDVWESIQKGEITGFSMGGTGIYSKEDVDLSTVQKSEAPGSEAEEKRGFLRKMAQWLGIENDPQSVMKSQVADEYVSRSRDNNFWAAESALEHTLRRYDSYSDEFVYESDPEVIKAALTDFSNIITSLLAGTPEDLVKSVAGPEQDDRMPVEKAGKAMSAANKKTLAGICESLNSFASQFDDAEDEAADKDSDPKKEEKSGDAKGETKTEDKTEETEVTKAEVQELIKSEIAKAAAPTQEKPTDQKEVRKDAEAEQLTADDVRNMIREELKKAAAPGENEPDDRHALVSKADAQQMVRDAVAAVLKSRGVPTSLNDEQEKVVKSGEDECYLHGLL